MKVNWICDHTCNSKYSHYKSSFPIEIDTNVTNLQAPSPTAKKKKSNVFFNEKNNTSALYFMETYTHDTIKQNAKKIDYFCFILCHFGQTIFKGKDLFAA